MDSLMHNKVCTLNEGLPTLVTFKGFLPSVDSLMHHEICALAKAFPTHATCKRFLPRLAFLIFNRARTEGVSLLRFGTLLVFLFFEVFREVTVLHCHLSKIFLLPLYSLPL